MSISPDEYHAMIKCASCLVRIKTRDSFDTSKQFRCPKCKTLLKVSGFDPERTMAVPETAPAAPDVVLAMTGKQEFTSESPVKSDKTWILLLSIAAGVAIVLL